MTDTNQFFPNPKAISSDLMYSVKSGAVPGRAYRASIQSTNSQQYQPGSLAVAYIPCGRQNTYLDQTQSYLRFTVQQKH